VLIIFVCLTGLVELVMESETLRKIQVRGHGLAGSFKDRTIVEWLQVHNPTELDFRKVSNECGRIHRMLLQFMFMVDTLRDLYTT